MSATGATMHATVSTVSTAVPTNVATQPVAASTQVVVPAPAPPVRPSSELAAGPSTTAPAITAPPTVTTIPTTPQATKPAGVTFPMHPTTATAAQVPAPAVGHASAADAGSIGGALFSLILVVALILGLGWLAKRMPGMQRGVATGHLKVVASIALGPRDRAVVVDVGGTQLLLGVGQGGVRALHTLEQPLPVVDSTAASPFAQVLAQHFGRKS